jgi:hypothetical protein
VDCGSRSCAEGVCVTPCNWVETWCEGDSPGCYDLRHDQHHCGSCDEDCGLGWCEGSYCHHQSCPPPQFELAEQDTACTFTAKVWNPPNYPTSWECEDATTLACEGFAECSWHVAEPEVLDPDGCVAGRVCPDPPYPPGDNGSVTKIWRLTYTAGATDNPCSDYPLRNPDQLKSICQAQFDASKKELFALCEAEQVTTCGAVECCIAGPAYGVVPDAGPPGPAICLSHAECPIGKVCKDKIGFGAHSSLFDPPGTCVDGCYSCSDFYGVVKGDCSHTGVCGDGSVHRGCPPGQACGGVRCVEGDCEVDGECKKGQRCDNNHCVAPQPIDGDYGATCPTGFHTVNLRAGGIKCVPGCDNDADCAWRIDNCDWSIDNTWTVCNKRTGGCQLDYWPPCQLVCVDDPQKGLVATPRMDVAGCKRMNEKAEKPVKCLKVDPNTACTKAGDILQGRCG